MDAYFLLGQPLKNNKYRIFKSRYDSIDSYLSSCGEKYNDIDLTIDEAINKQLLDAGAKEERIFNIVSEQLPEQSSITCSPTVCEGIDRLLAQHIAHLFIRDPLSVFEEKIHLDDENESDHFEVRSTPLSHILREQPAECGGTKQFSHKSLFLRTCSRPTGRR